MDVLGINVQKQDSQLIVITNQPKFGLIETLPHNLERTREIFERFVRREFRFLSKDI